MIPLIMLATMTMLSTLVMSASKVALRAAKYTFRLTAFTMVPVTRAWGWASAAVQWQIGLSQAAHFIAALILPRYFCDWMFCKQRGWLPLDSFVRRPKKPPDPVKASVWTLTYTLLLEELLVDALRWLHQSGWLRQVKEWGAETIARIRWLRITYMLSISSILIGATTIAFLGNVQFFLAHCSYLTTKSYFDNRRTHVLRQKLKLRARRFKQAERSRREGATNAPRNGLPPEETRCATAVHLRYNQIHSAAPEAKHGNQAYMTGHLSCRK